MSDYVEFNIRPSVPSQRGSKDLDGNKYESWIRYLVDNDKWYMDLTSLSDSSISIKSKALLPGVDLLGPHGYGHILGELWVEDTDNGFDNPTYEGMGDRWRLRYYPLE